jgi:hypothetical protein
MKGLITFTGAHYLSFFREIGSTNLDNDWVIYNDGDVEPRGTWEDIIRIHDESLNYPTVVIYERVAQNIPSSM